LFLYSVYTIDASKLREEHHVVGTLVGCLPRLPRQNISLGLPLQLLPEEVTLLLNKGQMLQCVCVLLYPPIYPSKATCPELLWIRYNLVKVNLGQNYLQGYFKLK